MREVKGRKQGELERKGMDGVIKGKGRDMREKKAG